MLYRSTEGPSSPILRLRGASVSYGAVRALVDVDFSAMPGEVVAVVGEHGAGKSTLAGVMYGTIPLSAGEIAVGGASLSSLSIGQAHGYGIELVHQQNMLFEQSFVAESLFIKGDLNRTSPIYNLGKMMKKASEFLGRFGIEIDPGARVKDLTLSDRVLVDILQHVYPGPRLLILDEALEKLSDAAFTKAIAIIKGLAAGGSSIVLITHDIDDISKLADSICILKSGRVLLFESMSAIDKINILKMAYTQMGHQASSSEADGEFYELLKYNEAILLNLPEILVVVDNSGRVRLVNESGRSFFGPALSSELPLPVATFFGDNSALLEGFIGDSSGREAGRTHYHVRLDSKAGKVVADVSIIPILDGEYRIGTIIVVADVTEQESMREQLVLSEKLASVGLLAAGVAHEINNPLEILKNNVNLIRLRERDAEAFELLDELDEELQSIRYITESLVNFCDGSGSGFEDFDLVELAWSLVRLVKKNAEEKRIRIEFERDRVSRIIVCANRNEIRQVLLNLYKNSCDAMPDGGDIAIRIDECVSDGQPMARLAFRDSGCGFSEENANDLFLPFYTTKKDKHNLGLGLSLSYSIINKFNGTLRAENLKPSGCQFTIELPMQPGAAEP